MNVRHTLSLALALFFAHAAPALADDDVAKAAAAYREAQQAELAEQHALASDLYALADQLAPAPEALRGAVRNAVAAERWAVAAGYALALRDRYGEDTRSAKLAADTLARTSPLLTRVTVDCGPADCTVLVDGKSASVAPGREHVVFVDPGKVDVSGGYADGTSDAVVVEGEAGGAASVVLEPPPPPPPDLGPNGFGGANGSVGDRQPAAGDGRRGRQRLSPWYFGVGAVATVGLAAGTALSGSRAQAAGDDFRAGGYTRELYDKANSLEIQTNVLLGVTAAVGVTTIVFAIFTDWKRGKKRRAGTRARVVPGGPSLGSLSVVGSF